MKSIHVLLLVCAIWLVLVGCSSNSAAVKVAEQFKEQQFQVDSVPGTLTKEAAQKIEDQLAVYETEQFKQNQAMNHITTLPQEVARAQGASEEMKKLKFKTISTSKDQKSVKLSYTGILVLHGGKVPKVPINGTMKLVNDQGTWKITNDEFNIRDVMDLMLDA